VARGAAENWEARVAGLDAAVSRLEKTLAAREGEIARKDRFILYQQDRIDELERSLEDVRRAGKRQSSPFRKGDPKTEPKTPGRKRGEAHGRHGHRPVPDRQPDRELEATLPSCCPECGGGEIDHERDAEQWQIDVPEICPTVTRFKVPVGRCRSCQAEGARGVTLSRPRTRWERRARSSARISRRGGPGCTTGWG